MTKEELQKKLDDMNFAELILFHSWFFGEDRFYMVEHLLEYESELEDCFVKYDKQAKKDWLNDNN